LGFCPLSSILENEKTPHVSVVIPYVEGISEKFKYIGVHLLEPGIKEILERWHIAFIVSLLSVAEAALVKQVNC
jgi:hypothetical protein